MVFQIKKEFCQASGLEKIMPYISLHAMADSQINMLQSVGGCGAIQWVLGHGSKRTPAIFFTKYKKRSPREPFPAILAFLGESPLVHWIKGCHDSS